MDRLACGEDSRLLSVQQKYEACVEALREFVRGAGFSDVVIGLSGGIDSAVVAAMAVDAFGSEHVHGVLLPGPYSSDQSVADALDLAERLGIDAPIVSINDAFAAFEEAPAPVCGGELAGLASENTQARCRMVVIMAMSNAHGWMMLNTGNKSEAMMGYSTLYGDTAGAFAPMGGLYKTDVFACARWRNEVALAEGLVAPIPENIIVKPPSAELAPDQEDERSLGIDYATLDAILIAAMECGVEAERKLASDKDAAAGRVAEELGLPIEQVERVLARVASYAFKRALEPPYPQVRFY